MKIDFVIPCLLGMESLIAAELRDFGAAACSSAATKICWRE